MRPPSNPRLLLVYPGSDNAQELDPTVHDEAVLGPLRTAFAAVQHHWGAVVEHAGRVIVVAPALAALGDPDRPLDAAVTGGLISLVRSLAIELQRHGATAHILFFDQTPDDPALQVMITALLDDDAGTMTGQEIYVTGQTSLGKLHP